MVVFLFFRAKKTDPVLWNEVQSQSVLLLSGGSKRNNEHLKDAKDDGGELKQAAYVLDENCNKKP